MKTGTDKALIIQLIIAFSVIAVGFFNINEVDKFLATLIFFIIGTTLSFYLISKDRRTDKAMIKSKK